MKRLRPGALQILPVLLGTLAIVLAGAGHAQGPGQPVSAPSAERVFLDRYCITCHNEKRKTAGLALDTMDVRHVGAATDTWEAVVRKLRTGAMPPVGMPRPDQATYGAVASKLESELDRLAAAAPNPGRPAVHRLNRAEYTNAVRDLLSVDIDAPALLPADETGYGFDNIADVLSVSPGLLERYLSAARKISRLAVGDTTMRPVADVFRYDLILLQDDRMSEDVPFGSRGGAAIRYHFPVAGEYLIKIRLHRGFAANIVRGLNNREQLDVRLDGARLKLFTIGGEGKEGGAYGGEGGYASIADDGLEVRFPATAGPALVSVAFIKRSSAAPEGMGPSRVPPNTNTFTSDAKSEMSVESVRIEGPFMPTAAGDTPSRRKIFLCRPGERQEESCAKTILASLARRAYRRPATDRDVQTLLAFYRDGQREGGFDAGIQSALERLLVSPEFLFRIERTPPNVAAGTAYRLSNVELASRLSFFLWSSIPDEQLLDLAAHGKLSDPSVFEHQITRMVADPRASELMSNFTGQWLQLRKIRTVTPDPPTFPEFDVNLRQAFERETQLFLESQFREDRAVPELLTANYTYLNERLARHYAVPNVYGSQFRRVTLADTRRFGLLGQGSILTATSYPTRTSPVLRGKWVLINIFGTPPPPPPPNVPDLKSNDEKAPTSVRERLEQHRRNPVCASCHSRMDPLGFALENFDAIGQWRTTDVGVAVDASGMTPDGVTFNGPVELRAVLEQHQDQFVTTVAEKLLTYALGRGLESSDMPAVRAIVREAAAHNYRWSSLVLGIVKSPPFQLRRSVS